MLQMTKLAKTTIQDRVRLRLFILVLYCLFVFLKSRSVFFTARSHDVILKRGAVQVQGARTVHVHGLKYKIRQTHDDWMRYKMLKLADIRYYVGAFAGYCVVKTVKSVCITLCNTVGSHFRLHYKTFEYSIVQLPYYSSSFNSH